jgi:putative hemolysin
MKFKIFLILSILTIVISSACTASPADDPEMIGMANPASVYCEEQNGTLKIRTNKDGSEYGVCIFEDGSECEEWAFFRDECASGDQLHPELGEDGIPNQASDFCRKQAYQWTAFTDEQGTVGVCIFWDGSACEEWDYYEGRCQPGEGSVEDITGVPYPDDTTGKTDIVAMPVTALYGYVISPSSKGPSDNLLILTPDGIGQFFVTGESGVLEEQIIAMKDQPEPANKANFWGRLDCPATDQCLLTVSKIRMDGPGEILSEPITEWEGVIYSGPEGPRSGGDDYFALLGDMHFQYGIDSLDSTLQQQLEDLRDSGQVIRINGELFAGRMDWNAVQIMVTNIELIDADPTDIPAPPNW